MVAVVGLVKIGKWGRWSQVLSNGESRPVSPIWTIMPENIRSYWLWWRHHNKQRMYEFDALLKMRKDIPEKPIESHDSP